jgi:hypothetical protein
MGKKIDPVGSSKRFFIILTRAKKLELGTNKSLTRVERQLGA